MPVEIQTQTSSPDAPARARLRVLHVQTGHLYGGIQRMLLCLAENRGHCPEMEPSFALCYEERIAQELAETGVPVHSLGVARIREPWTLLRARHRLRTLLAEEEFDVVICHGSWLLAVFGGVVRRTGIPLVLWMHNDSKAPRQNLIEIAAGLQQPQLVVANSHFTAASLPLLFTRVPRHVVVSCPVTPPPPRTHATAERARVRAQFDTPPEAVLLVLAGRPEAWKGHEQLLAALAGLRDLPGWMCWIIGGPKTSAQKSFLRGLEKSAAQSGLEGRVKFVGQREDVPELLAAADLFCQPNLTPEPFGIVFIEALYAGLPVVSARHGGAEEIVDESCGRLVTPNDPAELRETLRTLITDAALRAQLSRGAPVRGTEISDPARILPLLYEHLVKLRATRNSTGARVGNEGGKLASA
jgi:glycosyltransferase involved in cell wall biosynthesis